MATIYGTKFTTISREIAEGKIRKAKENNQQITNEWENFNKVLWQSKENKISL